MIAHVRFIDATGRLHETIAPFGTSLMRVATAACVVGIIGECGGCAACATCHAWIADPHLARLDPPDDVEAATLENVIDQRPNSRLLCQIRVDERCDGVLITVPLNQLR